MVDRLLRCVHLLTALALAHFPTAARALDDMRWTRVVEDPARSLLSVRNGSPGAVAVEWIALNDRTVFANASEIHGEIDAIAAEADGSDATRVFRFVTDNRTHDFPLTTLFDWLLTPTLFFNSTGVALCGEAAEQVNMLATQRGYQGREWGLNGHVVAEVRVDGRWQMYDADYGVYFLNRTGQIAGMSELVNDPSLITDPVLRLATPGPWSPYHPAYADLFATAADNFIWRTTPRETLPARPLVMSLPAGAKLRFPGRFAAAPLDFQGNPFVTHANLLLRLPAGSHGPIANPFLLHAVRGEGIVSIEGQVFPIGSSSLQDAIDARSGPIEQMELLEASSAVEILYLVNPKRWTLAPLTTLDLRVSVRGALSLSVEPAGDPAGDSDADGVRDDGDASGIVGDALCGDAVVSGCDDNCLVAANPRQLDADGDGVGNACDGDFDQDERVTDADFAVLEACRAGLAPGQDPGCAESDLDEDGDVDLADRVVFDEMSGRAVRAACGIGPELGVALGLLGWLRSRQRRGALPPLRRG